MAAMACWISTATDHLTDLYELEKVEDIETRNEILNKATNSRNLAYLARNAVEQRKKDQIKALCIEKLENSESLTCQ